MSPPADSIQKNDRWSLSLFREIPVTFAHELASVRTRVRRAATAAQSLNHEKCNEPVLFAPSRISHSFPSILAGISRSSRRAAIIAVFLSIFCWLSWMCESHRSASSTIPSDDQPRKGRKQLHETGVVARRIASDEREIRAKEMAECNAKSLAIQCALFLGTWTIQPWHAELFLGESLLKGIWQADRWIAPTCALDEHALHFSWSTGVNFGRVQSCARKVAQNCSKVMKYSLFKEWLRDDADIHESSEHLRQWLIRALAARHYGSGKTWDVELH